MISYVKRNDKLVDLISVYLGSGTFSLVDDALFGQ